MVAALDRPVLCPIFIGRDPALATLGHWLDRTRTGDGRTVLIAGEAGIGKSRLVAEVVTRATRQRFRILRGHCFEPDRALPYAPLLDLLRAYAVEAPEGELAQTFALAPTLAGLLPELVTSPSTLANDAFGGTQALEPEQEKRRLFHALTRFLLDGAAAQPMLVVVEDLHWCDDTSLEFLLHLARRAAGHPLLLLLTYRGDEAPPHLTHLLAEFDRGRRATEIALERLTLADTAAMLRAIFTLDRPVRADFLDVIYELTEGNPFFIEEAVTSLVAAGDIYHADGSWQLKEIGVLQVPRSVQDAVQRRAAQVSTPARQALAFAAIAGRRFDFALLREVLQVDEDALVRLIKELIGVHLVVEESSERFAFRHALTRQAIAATLLGRERRALHRRIAEAAERIAGVVPDAQLADLARHYFAAEVWGKALEYGRRAGERAQAMHTPRVAVEQFTLALDAAREMALAPSPDLYHVRALAYETLGEFERARADLEAALAAARSVGDSPMEWRVLLDLGFLWVSRDYDHAGDDFRRALDLARAIGDPLTLGHSLNRLGNWHLNAGRPHEAQHCHAEALTLFEARGDRQGIAETLDLLGMAHAHRGDLLQSAASYARAISLFRETGDRRGLSSSLVSLAFGGTVHYTTTDVAPVLDTAPTALCEEAIAIARAIGWRAGEAFNLLQSSYCLLAVGAYDRAWEMIREGAAIAEEIEHHQWQTLAQFALGGYFLGVQALPAARWHLERALAMAQEMHSVYWFRLATVLFAWTCRFAGDLREAEQALDAAFGPDGPMQSFQDRLCWAARAELAVARGEPERALTIVDHLIAATVNLSAERIVVPLWLLRGEALSALSRWEEAEETLQAAAAAAATFGSKTILWHILVTLGRCYRAQARRTAADRAFADARALIEELAATLPDEPVAEHGIDSLRAHFLAAAAALLPAPRPPTSRQAAKHASGGLTAREREVAALIAAGKSNRAIADALVVSERTVTTHVTSILTKLGFASRAQIAAWAVESGLKPATEEL